MENVNPSQEAIYYNTHKQPLNKIGFAWFSFQRGKYKEIHIHENTVKKTATAGK